MRRQVSFTSLYGLITKLTTQKTYLQALDDCIRLDIPYVLTEGILSNWKCMSVLCYTECGSEEALTIRAKDEKDRIQYLSVLLVTRPTRYVHSRHRGNSLLRRSSGSRPTLSSTAASNSCTVSARDRSPLEPRR